MFVQSESFVEIHGGRRGSVAIYGQESNPTTWRMSLKDVRAAQDRGDALGLSDDELAFYDALAISDSAVQVLGDETLRTIAKELVETVKRNTTIDWTLKESVRAKLRVYVKRVLRKSRYPPDQQERAVRTVLEQAEQLSFDWATALVPA